MHGRHNEEERAAAAGAGEAAFRAQGGSLYVVATPLGNLRDVTLRALDILGTADVIAAEDTRVSATLLRHYGIATRPVSVHAHNEAERASGLVAQLQQGRSVALITDAGTPGVSDPGARVVAAARAAGIPVVPLPGANAAICAVSAAGLAAERFFFAGFLPTSTKLRAELLARIGTLPCALLFYEAPHRVRQTVRELAQELGEARLLTIAREITKRFESIVSMPLGEAPEWFARDPNRERGEFVLIVDLPPQQDAPAALDEAGERWLRALLAHMSPAQAARIAAAATGIARGTLYAQAIAAAPRQRKP